MLRKEIDAIYTNKVGEYLSNGYSINTGTMHGSQGEIAHIDLRKGKEVIRIYMDQILEHRAKHLVIVVGRNTAAFNNNNRYVTIWNDSLEIIEQLEYAIIDDNWFVSLDEEKEIHEKQTARFRLRRDRTVSEIIHAEKIVLPFIRRQPNCKSVRTHDITRVYKIIDLCRGTTYAVVAKGATYYLK